MLNSPLMAPHCLFLWPLLSSALDHRLGGLALQKASVKIYLCVLQKDPKIQGACGMLSAVSVVTGIFFHFCKYHFCLSWSFLKFLIILIGGLITLINSIVMVFAIHQHELLQAYMCPPIWTPLPPPFLPYPSGLSRSTSLGALLHASNLQWSSVLHMVIYMFQCYSLKSSHPCLLPLSPKVSSLCQ